MKAHYTLFFIGKRVAIFFEAFLRRLLWILVGMASSTSNQPPTIRQQSFLLRCVCSDKGQGKGETAVWRFELRQVSAEPRIYRFSDLEELKLFIAAELTV